MADNPTMKDFISNLALLLARLTLGLGFALAGWAVFHNNAANAYALHAPLPDWIAPNVVEAYGKLLP